MRNEKQTLADRAHLLAQSHREWILGEAEALHDDLLVAGDEPMSFDETVDHITYGYLECVCSPLVDVALFADEMEPEGNFYTSEFVDAVTVAIEKVLS